MTVRRKCGKPLGSPKSGGRKAGTPNKVTSEFRETVRRLLDANADNIAVWLEFVAKGDLEHGRSPDPARALDLLIKLAEFAVPKMSRVEYTGAQNSPVRPTSIKVEFVNAPRRNSIPNTTALIANPEVTVSRGG